MVSCFQVFCFHDVHSCPRLHHDLVRLKTLHVTAGAEDSHTTGGASARPARWGEERRRNDIRLK